MRRLQLVQLQTPSSDGGAFTVIEVAPQAQVAVIRFFRGLAWHGGEGCEA